MFSWDGAAGQLGLRPTRLVWELAGYCCGVIGVQSVFAMALPWLLGWNGVGLWNILHGCT